MLKIQAQYEHTELLRACEGHMTSNFFEGGHIKSAASDVFTKKALDSYRPPKGKWMQHIVIVGTQEHFGPNRNGDGFPRQGLIKRSNTFVTHGHMFREHNNRSPKFKIGDIKAAAFNPGLHRTELILWGDCEKAAAEYADARAGKELSYSMSCRIPWDKCSCCHHQAPSPEFYCDHLQNDMLKYLPEFEKYAFAENWQPTFFDASTVARPADRIAHYLEYRFGDDAMAKAASSNRVITGCDWAAFEGVSIPDIEPLEPHYQAGLTKMAAVEGFMRGGKPPETDESFVKMANFTRKVFGDDELLAHELVAIRTLRPGSLFHEFAKRAMFMPFKSFVAYTRGKTLGEVEDSEAYKIAAAQLDRTFEKLACCCMRDQCDGSMAPLFEASDRDVAEFDGDNDDAAQQIMDGMIERFGIQEGPVRQRVIRITIVLPSSGKPKEASASIDHAEADNLLNTYAIYKLAACRDIAARHPTLAPEYIEAMACGQNATTILH